MQGAHSRLGQAGHDCRWLPAASFGIVFVFFFGQRPEVLQSHRCRLVVPAIELAGRWSAEGVGWGASALSTYPPELCGCYRRAGLPGAGRRGEPVRAHHDQRQSAGPDEKHLDAVVAHHKPEETRLGDRWQHGQRGLQQTPASPTCRTAGSTRRALRPTWGSCSSPSTPWGRSSTSGRVLPSSRSTWMFKSASRAVGCDLFLWFSSIRACRRNAEANKSHAPGEKGQCSKTCLKGVRLPRCRGQLYSRVCLDDDVCLGRRASRTRSAVADGNKTAEAVSGRLRRMCIRAASKGLFSQKNTAGTIRQGEPLLHGRRLMGPKPIH